MNRTGSRAGTIPRAALLSMLLMAALLAAPTGRAQDKSGCSFSVDQATRSRGDPFTLSIANGPAAVGTTAVTLAARDGQAVRVERPTYAAANGNVPAKVTGKIATSAALGSYTVDVEFEGMPCSSSDPKQRLRVVPAGNPEIHECFPT